MASRWPPRPDLWLQLGQLPLAKVQGKTKQTRGSKRDPNYHSYHARTCQRPKEVNRCPSRGALVCGGSKLGEMLMSTFDPQVYSNALLEVPEGSPGTGLV